LKVCFLFPAPVFIQVPNGPVICGINPSVSHPFIQTIAMKSTQHRAREKERATSTEPTREEQPSPAKKEERAAARERSPNDNRRQHRPDGPGGNYGGY
jgi:hypothetical protein